LGGCGGGLLDPVSPSILGSIERLVGRGEKLSRGSAVLGYAATPKLTVTAISRPPTWIGVARTSSTSLARTFSDNPGRGIDLIHDRVIGLGLRIELPIVEPVPTVTKW
jgi:hypothetical protein